MDKTHVLTLEQHEISGTLRLRARQGFASGFDDIGMTDQLHTVPCRPVKCHKLACRHGADDVLISFHQWDSNCYIHRTS
jgi:hypothetical protein